MNHFDPLEADFTRYYQIDLPAAVWGPDPISTRRFGVLVKGLPGDSALKQALSPHPGWGYVEELLVSALEQIDLGNRLMHSAHFKEPHPAPVRIRRPWDTEREAPKMATSAEMVAFFKRTGGI